MTKLTDSQILLVLKRGRELIETKGWNQFAFGLDETGDELDERRVSANRATCFCTLGAVISAAKEQGWVSFEDFDQDVELISGSVEQAMGLSLVDEWNDEEGRTKDEVLALFDTTIERLAA